MYLSIMWKFPIFSWCITSYLCFLNSAFLSSVLINLFGFLLCSSDSLQPLWTVLVKFPWHVQTLLGLSALGWAITKGKVCLSPPDAMSLHSPTKGAIGNFLAQDQEAISNACEHSLAFFRISALPSIKNSYRLKKVTVFLQEGSTLQTTGIPEDACHHPGAEKKEDWGLSGITCTKNQCMSCPNFTCAALYL